MSTNTPRRGSVMWRITAGVSFIGLAGLTAILTLPSVSATPSDKVTVCHRLPSPDDPYTAETVDVRDVAASSEDNPAGHADHTGPVFTPGMASGWGDIIPPATDASSGISLPGYNWDATGQVIWNADCNVIAASPTPTPPTSTPAPTPTPTVITSPTIDGVTRPEPQPATTDPPDLGSAGGSGDSGNVGNPSSASAPLGVDAGGGGPTAPERSAWLWLIPAGFLALLVASMRRIFTEGRRDSSR
jgi:hypothetical protein